MERMVAHREAYLKEMAYLEGLDNTPCGLTCGGCGTLLETEGDFARHFVVSRMDEMNNNLNLGNCPNKDV